MKDDDLPRIFPDECIRTEMEENGKEISWVTCLKRDSVIADSFSEDGWEREHVRAIASILTKYPDAAYLDVGSNIGPHTCLAAKFTNRAYALDPSKENLAYIRHSLKLAGTENNVVLINNVVSNETVELFPYQQDPFNQGWTYFLNKDEWKRKTQNYATGESLMSVTFQQVLDKIPDQTIILKIDVEASECKVLSDFLLKEDKEKYIPFILMEWRGIQDNSEGLCPDHESFIQAFLKAGYVPMTVDHISKIKQLKISDLRRKNENGKKKKLVSDVLWIHKQALQKLGKN